MKGVLCLLLILAALIIVKANPTARIVKYEYSSLPDKGYTFFYETTDGQKRQETGMFRKVDDALVWTVEGFFSYVGTDFKVYTTRYKADENGYRTY